MRAIIISLFLCLVGCVSHQNISLSENFWQTKQPVTIVSIKAPTPQTYVDGTRDDFLSITLKKVFKDPLDAHLKKADLSWYYALPNKFATRLKQKNIPVNIDSQSLATVPSNYSAIGQTNGTVLVLELNAFGALTQQNVDNNIFGDQRKLPRAQVILTGTLIDSHTNQVLWKHRVPIIEDVQGKWDQPPNYPDFDATLASAINSAEQELIDSFFSGS
jgi:hypothetical protein